MPLAAVGEVGTPVSAGDAGGAFKLRLVVIVVAKFASSFNAAANSFNVFKAPGAASTNAVISLST